MRSTCYTAACAGNQCMIHSLLPPLQCSTLLASCCCYESCHIAVLPSGAALPCCLVTCCRPCPARPWLPCHNLVLHGYLALGHLSHVLPPNTFIHIAVWPLAASLPCLGLHYGVGAFPIAVLPGRLYLAPKYTACCLASCCYFACYRHAGLASCCHAGLASSCCAVLQPVLVPASPPLALLSCLPLPCWPCLLLS